VRKLRHEVRIDREVVLRALAAAVGEDFPHVLLAEVEVERPVQRWSSVLTPFDNPADLSLRHFEAPLSQHGEQIPQTQDPPPE